MPTQVNLIKKRGDGGQH